MKRANYFQEAITYLTKTESINIFLIIFVWILAAIIVNPLGDFPLNDDWVYGRAAQSIIEKGNFTLAGGNTSANLIVQAFWGALFCIPFGFSFSALRISTLTLGLIGVLATYKLLRAVETSRPISLFGALSIALNPIYFSLSNTFMTDVPFFTLAVLSIYLLVIGLKQNRFKKIIAGILISYLSLFIRQNGIIILVAFGFAYLVKKGWNKINVFVSFLPVVIGIFLQLAYQSWLDSTNRTSPNFNLQSKGLSELIFSGNVGGITSNLILNASMALCYLGLFTAPLIIPIFLNKFKSAVGLERRLITIVIATICPLMLIGLFKKNLYMPLGGNVLVKTGIGPLTLHDTSILNIDYPFNPAFLKYIWLVLTVVSVFSAAILTYYLIGTINQIFQRSKSEQIDPKWIETFVVLLIVLYFLPLGITRYFDRYLLILMPLLMVIISIYKPTINKITSFRTKTISIALVIMLTYGCFTVGATHDYLSWNRVRWQALDYLIKDRKILPNQIDGGYEFNGWYLYDPKNTYALNFKKNPSKPNQSWWYVDKDDYMITFGPLSTYEELQKYPTDRWLPFGPETIYVLHKK
jgi:hypothetical protein